MRLTDAQFDSLKNEIKEWILRIDEDEAMPKSIKALNFGLTEPYGIELTGANIYNSEDDDWVFSEDFVPDERYCPDLNLDEHIDWEYFRKVIIRALKEIDEQLKGQTELLKVPHITTGFVGNGLVLIR